jgi:hypothetical protein
METVILDGSPLAEFLEGETRIIKSAYESSSADCGAR